MTDIDTTDLFDTPQPTIRRPADAFERHLFRAHLQRVIEGWTQTTYKASIGHQMDEDGTWPLYIASRRVPVTPPGAVGDIPLASWPQMLDGRVWLAERDGRPVVAWSLEDGRTGEEFGPVAPFGIDV